MKVLADLRIRVNPLLLIDVICTEISFTGPYLLFSEAKQQQTPVLLTIKSTAKEDENIPGTRELYIGCVRTMAVSQKKVWLLSPVVMIW